MATAPQHQSMTDTTVLSVRDLKAHIPTRKGVVKAVDGVSFDLSANRSLGIVGETGSGKSMTAFTIMQLLPTKDSRIESGSILYRRADGNIVDIAKLQPYERRMRELRARELALVFQSSLSTLNPVYTIGFQIAENITHNTAVNRADAKERAVELLKHVGINAPERRIKQFPHELSGGMRQRALIALALSADPRVLIADEPTTALDVTIEAQILELISEVQQQREMGVILITHDMGVIAQAVDDVMVMYMGDMVEYADISTLFSNPKHPYTIKLLESIVKFGSRNSELKPIAGTIPDPLSLNSGCKFFSRCPWRRPESETQPPPLVEVEPGHFVKCSLYGGSIA